jgi:hypothetical protein
MKVLQGPEGIRKGFLHHILSVPGVIDDAQAGIIHRLRVLLIDSLESTGISPLAALYQFVV